MLIILVTIGKYHIHIPAMSISGLFLFSILIIAHKSV